MLKLELDFNDRQLQAKLRKIVFKNGRLKCPHCGSFIIRKVKSEKRYYCKRCRKKFSLLSSSWLKNIKIPLAQFTILLQLWLKGYGVAEVSELVKLSVPTIRKYYSLFRLNIVKSIDFKAENNVQVDEAYFGRFKKDGNVYHSWRTYHSPPKTCVAGIGCPANGLLATRVIEGTKGEKIRKFIYEQVPTDVHVYSDGSHIYTNLRKDYHHTSQTHDLGFENAYYIESCWSWMKRKLFKQYHHFHKKNAVDYVSELTWRFNIRKMQKNALDYLQKSL